MSPIEGRFFGGRKILLWAQNGGRRPRRRGRRPLLKKLQRIFYMNISMSTLKNWHTEPASTNICHMQCIYLWFLPRAKKIMPAV